MCEKVFQTHDALLIITNCKYMTILDSENCNDVIEFAIRQLIMVIS